MSHENPYDRWLTPTEQRIWRELHSNDRCALRVSMILEDAITSRKQARVGTKRRKLEVINGGAA